MFSAVPMIAAITLLGCCGAARGQDAAIALEALRTGDSAQALVVVDRALAATPRDPALRFTRGVVLAEMGRDDEAVSVFTSLIQSHPQLPEPYNNLAVLQARRGDADAARASLEAAVRRNPRHATAHENLGDVYAALAARAWARAVEIDPGRTGASSKLERIRALQPGARVDATATLVFLPTPHPPR